MRKKIKILILSLLMILTSIITVNAADATVGLKVDNKEVKRGDTFTVILNASCEEGINGLNGSFGFDTNKLELVKLELEDTNKWVNLDSGLNFSIICNSVESIKTADIIKLTLKVKETAEEGTTKIQAKDLMLDSDVATNSNKNIGTKEIEITIKEQQSGQEQEPEVKPENPQEKKLTGIEIKESAKKTTYTEGEKFDKTGMKVIAKYSDGSSKEISNYTITNGDKITKGQTSVTIKYTENNVTKTTTQKITVKEIKSGEITPTVAGKIIPKAGIGSIVGVIGVIIIFGVVCLLKYDKYKKI